MHAVHQTYLYFYSAISYEALGRAAHKYSSNKLSLLHSALDCFTTCSAVLPSTTPVSDFDGCVSVGDTDGDETSLVDDTSPGSSPDSSFLTTEAEVESPSIVKGLVGSLTKIIDDSMAWDEDDPFISHEHEEQVEQNVDVGLFRFPREESKGRLVPLPLQIRKLDEGSTCAEKSYRPSPLPNKIFPFEAKHTGSKSQEHSEHIKSIARYNNSIHFLRAQINTSIATIHTLITSVTKLQRARKASRTQNLRRVASFWSFSPVQPDEDTSNNGCLGRNPSAGASASACGSQSPEWGGTEEQQQQQQQQQESKAERIARLRAEGWKTVGVRNGRRGWKGAAYYEAYCNGVLDELYLGES